MHSEEFLKLDAAMIARLISTRDLSPVEVLEASLSRLNDLEPALNAFDSVDLEGARVAARSAERQVLAGEDLGPLHGVPVSVKDLIDVRGLPARYGSLTLQHNVAAADAPSVERLRKAGAIIVGKTTTSELGARGYTSSRVHGITKSPWSLARTPGGSSGGAAASVAAGVTPFALGTDGGGSVRVPAAFTGLFGIKATFGRVPVWPASATPTLAHVGPLARTLDDAELLLRVVSGADPRDQFSYLPGIGEALDETELSRLRIAFAPSMGYGSVDAAVNAAVTQAVLSLSSGFQNIEEIDAVCDEAAEIFVTEFMAGCAARLSAALENAPDDLDPVLRLGLERFRRRTAQDVAEVLRARYQFKEQITAFFRRYDLLITPTAPCVSWNREQGVPPGHEHEAAWSYFTYPFNLTGHPAGTIPCGLTNDGMPIGLQIVAPLCREDRLLGAMRVFSLMVSRGFGHVIDPRP